MQPVKNKLRLSSRNLQLASEGHKRLPLPFAHKANTPNGLNLANEINRDDWGRYAPQLVVTGARRVPARSRG